MQRRLPSRQAPFFIPDYVCRIRCPYGDNKKPPFTGGFAHIGVQDRVALKGLSDVLDYFASL
jgi:hypothetical protein